MHADREDATIQKLKRLGEQCQEIRAIILTSTRAVPGATTDAFSDFDPVVYVTDITPFAQSEAWFADFGPVLVVLRRDLGMPDGKTFDGDPEVFTRLVLYEDGTKIDFVIAPVEALGRECRAAQLSEGFDVGYRVLVDKDGEAGSLSPPTYRAHIPTRPTELHYATLVNNFWWNSTYVAKHLWRDDVVAARSMLDGLTQDFLLKMLEWRVELDRDWSWRPGLHGRGLGKVLDAETYDQLVAAYVGEGAGRLWEALFGAAALFRKTALRVGEGLGYTYLRHLDERVTAYLETVRQLDRAATRGELAGALTERYRGGDRGQSPISPGK